jgi:predicted membrane protein
MDRDAWWRDPRRAERELRREARRSAGCQGSPVRGAFVGLVIIGIGILLLMSNLGIIAFRDIWDFVPLILVFIGAQRLIDAAGRPMGSLLGGMLVALGGLWFIANMGWFHIDHRVIAPAIIIMIGALFLVRAIERQTIPPSTTTDPAELVGTLNEWALFGGIKRNIAAPNFLGGSLFAMFGGIEIDLRRAGMISEEAVLDANAVFGGIELHVPPSWTVVIRGQSIFGGYEDKTLPASSPDSPPRHLILTGMALFGGVSIGN